MSLTNASGSTNGVPFVRVDAGSDGVLSPGENASVTLQLRRSHITDITFTPHVASGVVG